jgi:hypothetical protein
MTVAGRITKHYQDGMTFHALMLAVYPPAQYPKAWRTPTSTNKTGTPACMMPFVSALKKMNASYSAADNTVTIHRKKP